MSIGKVLLQALLEELSAVRFWDLLECLLVDYLLKIKIFIKLRFYLKMAKEVY